MKLRFKAAPGASDQLKDGRKVTFLVQDDSAPDSAWESWEFYAVLEGKEAGFLHTTWVTPERFDRLNPTMWHFLQHHDNWSYRNMDANDLNEVWAIAKQRLFGDNSAHSHVPEPAKRNEDLARWAKNPKFVKTMKEFKDFHVNKPVVDLIRVHEGFKNNWVALALYEYAAKWLAEKGLGLYIGAQNENSKGVWAYMEKHPEWYPIYIEPGGKNPSRKKLDYSKQ
jgi:GNAT superfamily N-acetyltransferase